MKSAAATDNVMIKIWKFTEFHKKKKVKESVKISWQEHVIMVTSCDKLVIWARERTIVRLILFVCDCYYF